METIKYDVLSPDGISIHFSDVYSTREEAVKALEKWMLRFKAQGYYSSSMHGRIPLDELNDFCRIIEV